MLLSVPTDFLPRLKAEEDVHVGTLPGTGIFYIPINTTVEPFTDIKVREATALAINQEEILTSLFGGVGSVANNFLIGSLLAANVDPALNISYNPDRSKTLLEEAGWTLGSGGVREKAGVPLQVSLWTQNGTEFKRVQPEVGAGPTQGGWHRRRHHGLRFRHHQ